jgi:hypothetical protein
MVSLAVKFCTGLAEDRIAEAVEDIVLLRVLLVPGADVLDDILRKEAHSL